MATIANRLPAPRLRERLARTLRGFFLPGDVTTLLIAVVLLLMPVLALGATGWPLDNNTLLPVTILSVLFGFLLARSQYNELFGLMISSIYGACFVLLVAAINLPGGLGEALYEVFSRLFRWFIDATAGGINQDELVFTVLVASLFWFLGHNLAWHLFRVDRLGRAVLPPGLILVTNAIYYTGEVRLEMYMIGFAFMALLLVVRSNLEAREWDWYMNGIRVPRALRQQFFRVGAALALLVLVVAWAIPQGDLQDRLERFQEFMQSEPLQQLAEVWNRLIASADTEGPATADYYGGDSLQLGGAIRLGDQVVFLASAPLSGRRYYWRSRVFDNYDMGRWTSAADTRLTDPESPLEITHEAYVEGARVPVQQTFTMGLNASRLVYTAPQPAQVNLATRTDLRYAPDQSMSVSVVRPMRVIYEGESYTATSLMSSATAAQLRAAGTNYPTWVTDVYTSYVPSATARTLELARQIVAQSGATNPYDVAKAVETYLRANILYNESIPQPPIGRDPVDWVLFDYKQGYCNYYASAMVVMLRSLGIPARMAAGFAQGTWEAGENAFVVRERDAHTWVEVYFPGYGWVEFEPTAAQAPLTRGDEAPPPQAQQPTLTPSPPPPSPTPIPPTATPPPPTATPPDPNANAPAAEPPTLTPSPTPSFTPTPIIVPTQQPPVRPQPRDPFAFILPAIAVALAGILVIALLIVLLVLIYWWWEWRGMRGLSPISRAYARLERYAALLGLRLSDRHTPEERRDRILRELPPAAEPPVTAITRLYTAERYGPQTPVREEARKTPADRAWTRTRESILKRWLRRRIPFRRGE